VPLGRLRASFLRVLVLFAVLLAGTDAIFFWVGPQRTRLELVGGQAILFGLVAFFGMRYLGLVRSDDGAHYPKFVVPNVLTLGRVLAIPGVIAGAALARTSVRATVGVATLFVVASISDLLDGWISRRFARASLLGRVLDPLADALFYSSVSVGLWRTGVFPIWLAAIAVLRFVPSMIAGVVLFARHGPQEISPTRLGKASSFALGVATGTYLARVILPAWMPRLIVEAAAVVAAGLGLASVIEYVRLGARRLRPNGQ
jgi:cardiolipin synthase